MKIKDNINGFISLTENKEIWNEVLNNSERSGVLTSAAAFDVQLERLLKKFLVQNLSTSQNIAEKSHFSHKINLCFSLGLITEDEKHDLKLLRDIRNAFAHNIFGCNFENTEVSKAIFSLSLPNKIQFTKDSARNFFNIGMIMIDVNLNDRSKGIKPTTQLANLRYANEA